MAATTPHFYYWRSPSTLFTGKACHAVPFTVNCTHIFFLLRRGDSLRTYCYLTFLAGGRDSACLVLRHHCTLRALLLFLLI